MRNEVDSTGSIKIATLNDSKDSNSISTSAVIAPPSESITRVSNSEDSIVDAPINDFVAQDESSPIIIPAVVAIVAVVEPVLIEPTPNPLPNLNSILSQPSRTPTPTLITKLETVTPSASPVPTKKFASSLSLNKKFLEKASEKSKVEVKVAVARLATPPVPPPVSSHPRLMKGKISLAPALSLSTAQASGGISGWSKAAPVPEGSARPSVPIQSVAFSNRNVSKGRSGSFGSGGRTWAGSRGGLDLGPAGIASDFPTAAEAANEKVLRAAALLEQMQSRDRAIQARAAAAAAANAHLLEGLDAFRGVHLDPNAHHWDEMGDEEDDFLDETIEFGDGTQYKIENDAPTTTRESTIPEELLSEPDPSDFATLEAPLEEGDDSIIEPTTREERFKDDYDRTWVNKPAAEPKNLFNDRLGKLEPYANTATKGQPGQILGRGPPPQESRSVSQEDSRSTSTRKPSIDVPPHLSQHPHPPTTDRRRESVSSDKVKKEETPRIAWAIPREQTRQTSDASQGRQLPPHLTAPIVSTPPPPPPPAVVVAPIVEVPKVVDIEELHSREMHAAAERAKVRRQEEELARVAQMERAKKKAEEIAEKMKPTIVVPPSPLVDSITSPSSTAPTERVNSWRKPVAAPVEIPIVPIVKIEPIKILAREPVILPTPARPSPPLVAVRTPVVPHPSIHKTISSNLPINNKSVPPHLAGKSIPPSVSASPVFVPLVQPEREWRRDGSNERNEIGRQAPPHLSRADAISTQISILPTPSNTATPTSPSNSRPLAPIVGKVIKVADTSVLDALMSRVKGAMLAPKPILQDAPQTIFVQRVEAEAIATVRLPSSSMVAIIPEVTVKEAFVKGKGKGKGKKVVVPVSVPMARKVSVGPFSFTILERSVSPPPAWKAYLVGLPMYLKLSSPSAKHLKAFLHPNAPGRVVAMTPSRKVNGDDFLFVKKPTGRRFATVAIVLPKNTIVRRTRQEEKMLADSKKVIKVVAAVETRTIENDETLYEGDSKPLPRSRLPSAGGFTNDIEKVEELQERKFMVTGGLNGDEVVKVATRENLSAPGDRTATISLPLPSSKSAPVFDSSTVVTTSSTNWPAPAPLSLLDPTNPSVWSAPPAETPIHTRSISLSGLQVGNSLQGIADDDPSATIPNSLADLKSEDGGSEVNSVKLEDSRLRNQLSSFPQSELRNQMESPGQYQNHFPNRYNLPPPPPPPSQQQQFHRPPPTSNQQYGMPSSYGYSSPIAQAPTQSLYSSQQFSPYQSSYSPYSNSGPFSLPPPPLPHLQQQQQQQSSPFNNYRPMPMSGGMPFIGMQQYGPVGGNFGAVGGSPHQSQQIRPQFHPRSPNVQQNSYSNQQPTNQFNGFNSNMNGMNMNRGDQHSHDSHNNSPMMMNRTDNGRGGGGDRSYGSMASPVIPERMLQHGIPSSIFSDLNRGQSNGMQHSQAQGNYRRPY